MSSFSGPLENILSNDRRILQFSHYTSVFQAVFGYQNDTLKVCNDTLNSESLNMVLPCIVEKRFEISMFSCTWLLQQTAAML